jgi:DNA polymerase IV
MDERHILHIDMDAFFASVEQSANPFLRGKPVIVGGNRTLRSIVATASYEARAFGIRTGMPLGQAFRLCPHAILVMGDTSKYADTSRRIFTFLNEISPLVEIFSIDEAFLDLTPRGCLIRDPIEAAYLIKSMIRFDFHFTCSIGIGPNKLIAKLASEMEKPDGLVWIRKKEVQGVLEKLPVDKLCGIGPHLKKRLAHIGITTCGKLRRISLKTLTKRFGIMGGRRLYQMGRGISESSVMPFFSEPLAKSMGHVHTLSHDTSDRENIETVLLMLCEKVARRLREKNFQGRVVTFVIRFSDFETLSRQHAQPHLIDRADEILKAALKIFSEMGCDHRAVRMLGVSVSNLVQGARQLDLLEEDQSKRRLTETLDEINDKYGEFTMAPAAITRSRAYEPHYDALKTKGKLTHRLETWD